MHFTLIESPVPVELEVDRAAVALIWLSDPSLPTSCTLLYQIQLARFE